MILLQEANFSLDLESITLSLRYRINQAKENNRKQGKGGNENGGGEDEMEG
ncbi:hypothetical protein ACU8V7_23875 [Zobellia nedashkovskayae]